MSTPYPIVRCGVRCRCPDLDAHRMPPCWFAQTSKECLYTTPNAPGLSNQKLIFQLASENLSAKARILPLTHDRYGSFSIDSAGFGCRSMSALPRKRPAYCVATK